MSEGEGLQFERAEFENAPAQAQCAQCHRDLIGSYYEVDGQTVCEACKYTIESRMTDGSGAGRFVRATGAGLVAAALGAALYYAITAISGYEFGLIAIVVGFGVGTAVRWGSNGRGGKRSQALAMALTYLAIVATYVMGLRLGGQGIGLAGAALLATSPSFLFQLTAAPMSDVPVTAWWALALALVLVDHLAAALFSGLAVSLAILTRPNLAPLALIPVAALIWEGLRDRARLRRAVTRAATYSAGVIPGCVLIGMLYAAWYGSPFKSGYGSLDSIYHWPNAWPNLARYPAWTAESQTPLVALAFAAPMLVSRVSHAGRVASQARVIAMSWVGFIVLVLASYLLYEAFNAWWFVRFMLPAFPPLLVLTSVSIVALSQRLSLGRSAQRKGGAWLRVLIPSALVAVMMWHGIVYAIDHDVFSARSERKYAAVADYVSRRLPPNAALLSMQHSGSIRYYSGRATVRFDHIEPAQLESTLAALAEAGYRPYILLEPWEVPQFRKRYTGFSPLSSLDWPPVAVMRNTDIRFYDPADRPASLAGRPLLTETVP